MRAIAPQDDDPTTAWILAGLKTCQHLSGRNRELVRVFRARCHEKRPNMACIGQEKHDPASLAVASLQSKAPGQRLPVTRRKFRFHADPPARCDDHPVPRPLVAGARDRNLGRPSQEGMQVGRECRKQGDMPAVPQRAGRLGSSGRSGRGRPLLPVGQAGQERRLQPGHVRSDWPLTPSSERPHPPPSVTTLALAVQS